MLRLSGKIITTRATRCEDASKARKQRRTLLRQMFPARFCLSEFNQID
jgi:hypothetical protein